MIYIKFKISKISSSIRFRCAEGFHSLSAQFDYFGFCADFLIGYIEVTQSIVFCLLPILLG